MRLTKNTAWNTAFHRWIGHVAYITPSEPKLPGDSEIKWCSEHVQ